MKMALGSDHRGYRLKESLKAALAARRVETLDMGCASADPVDYPDVAARVATAVSECRADQGILVCGTGMGMSIAANRFPRVRAALCYTPEMAATARVHNNANVLVLGGDTTTPELSARILDAWLSAAFESGGRHERRVSKLTGGVCRADESGELHAADPEIHAAVLGENARQSRNIELIASENFTSRAVRETQGSVMTNKYAEGYPGRRYYNGCEFVDAAERLAIERAKELFGADHANVQPHCGSAANMAVYFAVMKPGDTMMAMSLDHGGHLTHGHKVNFSGRFFNVVHYGVRRDNEQLDYDAIDRMAAECRPKLIVAGASAYPRVIDFARLRRTADAVGAPLMVDMAHFAGLVAGGAHPNPVPLCEFVTTTTHKTLRGPRGGMILCRKQFADDIDRQVFPGLQGGPLMHVIAGKAVCFREAQEPAFRDYARQIVANASTLAATLAQAGLRIVSGGTDTHLMLVDLTPINVTGKDAAAALEKVGVTVNKNCIPFDPRSPFVTSGIRVGTPAVTTRGMKEPEMLAIAAIIVECLRHIGDAQVAASLRGRVDALTARFPKP